MPTRIFNNLVYFIQESFPLFTRWHRVRSPLVVEKNDDVMMKFTKFQPTRVLGSIFYVVRLHTDTTVTPVYTVRIDCSMSTPKGLD